MFYHSLQGHKRWFSSRLKPFHVAAVLCALLLSGPALSLPDDRDQPIRITADTAIRDEKQGFTVYSGNVHMIQGSLDIVADKLTIYHENDDADKIVAIGNPAKMKQRPALDEPMVRARAQTIEYYKLEDRVHLKMDAHITRDDGSSVAGDSIDYYIADELIKADSDQSPDGKPIVVVIPPTAVREKEAVPAPEDVQQENSADAPAQIGRASCRERV